MPEKQTMKPERTPHKKVIKLPPAIGDWTTYRPAKVYTKKVRSGLYGFDRLPEEILDLAIKTHYNFFKEVLHFLKVELKIGNELFALWGEQSDYLHFLRSASGQVVQLKITLGGYDEAAVMLIDLSLANSMVNHALGSKDTEFVVRGLTDLENEILDSIIKKITPFFAKVFEPAVKTIEIRIINSPDITIDPTINPANSFVVFGADVSFNDNPPAKIAIGYPGSLIKLLLEKLQALPTTKTLSLDKLPAGLLNQLSIPVSVAIGSTWLSTNDINSLEAGDVISIDRQLDHAIEVKIGDKIILLGQPGRSDKKFTARIVGLKHDERVRVKPAQVEEPEIEPQDLPAETCAVETSPPAPPPPPSPAEIKKAPALPTLRDKIKSINLEELAPSLPPPPPPPGSTSPPAPAGPAPISTGASAVRPVAKPAPEFSLEEEEKEEYPVSQEEFSTEKETPYADEELEESFEEGGPEETEEEETEEDVLGEENLNLDDFSLKNEDLMLDDFSLKDTRPSLRKKNPEGK
jgi:flagellar motor switch protein FliM